MNQRIENYIPQNLTRDFRKQAWKVWTISMLVVFLWVFLILLAPIAKINGFAGISAPIYKAFGFICHQLEWRSFYVGDHPFAVCSRCFGIYFGLLFGFLIYPFRRKIEDIEAPPRFWLFLSMIPIALDWSLGAVGIWENTHLSRFTAGGILGAACAIFIVPALVEIFRYLKKRPTKKAVV